ncbi:MAG: thermonuclease family protein [Pseudomonadota bacterium]
MRGVFVLAVLSLGVFLGCDEAGGGTCGGEPVVGLQGTSVPAFCYLAKNGCSGGRWDTVTSVYDGDTLTLSDGSKVRLLGINAPEQPDGGAAGDPDHDPVTCGGPDAGNYLRSWVMGRQVCLRDSPLEGPEEDKYGRQLKYVFVDGVNVNLLMVATGHACYYDAFSEAYCHEAYLAEEARADSLSLGIWGLCADIHADPCARND